MVVLWCGRTVGRRSVYGHMITKCDPPQEFDAKGESTRTTRLHDRFTKLWGSAHARASRGAPLKSDLTALDLWADRWQVKFHPSKCEVMRVTHNKEKSTTRYQISGTELRNVFNIL